MEKQKVRYVDGFVLLVPKDKYAAYKKMARDAGKVWREFGALNYKECVIDDAKPNMVLMTFDLLTKAKPDEQVWFSYIEFKSKSHRDQVNKKVMAYMEKKYADKKDMEMPFDMKRMSYGGFKVVVD